MGAFYRILGPMELSAAIGYTTDHLNEAQIFYNRRDESEMIQAFDPERFHLCTSPELG